MKINWKIIKYNFYIQRFSIIALLLLCAFYLIVGLLTNGFIDEEQTIEEATLSINQATFIIFWLPSFFETIFLINKFFYKDVKKGHQEMMLYSKLTRRDLFISNWFFLVIYFTSRLIIYFILGAICYAINPHFYLGKFYWMLFNILINSLFIGLFFLLICLLTFEKSNRQLIFTNFIGGAILMVMIPTVSDYGLILGETFNVWIFLSYFPFFGLTSPAWIQDNHWQAFLNLPISLVGISVLFYFNIQLNQKIEY